MFVLSSQWEKIVRHAWSVRWLALAGLLSGIEAALPYLFDLGVMPRWASRALIIAMPIIIMAAFVARISAQKEFEESQ